MSRQASLFIREYPNPERHASGTGKKIGQLSFVGAIAHKERPQVILATDQTSFSRIYLYEKNLQVDEQGAYPVQVVIGTLVPLCSTHKQSCIPLLVLLVG